MISGAHRDERGLVGGSFFRLAIFLLLIGILAVETASIVFARVQTQDVAETAAAEAAGKFKDTADAEAAQAAAITAIQDKDPRAALESFQVAEDGTVQIVVYKRAKTFLVHRIGFLKGFADARGDAVGLPPPA